jgi:hypothetical protein
MSLQKEREEKKNKRFGKEKKLKNYERWEERTILRS